VTTLQLEYTERELLATEPVEAPLVAGGVRCHGGFDAHGNYVSPRTLNRVPAIEAWQAHHAEQFGTGLLDVALETWPETFPNVAQAKFLLREAVRDPIVATLTRIGTVEGFGALIRTSIVPDLQRCFVEDVRGTAMTHLQGGLYEAHARDEAGHGDEGGHRQMWFAARDIAFENPMTEDETATMLERMGIAQPGSGGVVDPAQIRAQMLANRLFPDDVSFELEAVIERMVRLLLIEISAFHTFAWAEELLSDDELVAGDGEAARLVSYVRADETPHVEYLKTTLTEMRDRTFVGDEGQTYAGRDLIGRIWDRALEESLGVRREQNIRITEREIEHALAGNPRRAEVLEEFHSLGAVHPILN
jgi:hypothetical protein